MKIYFVRHGQSESNLTGTIESNPKLSALGVKQSQKIASRVANLPFKVIIASDLARALQTAEIISKRGRKKLVIARLLREERHSSELEGRYKTDPEVIRVRKILYKNRNRTRWHFSDEENFFDLKKRAERCLRFLEKRKEKNILVAGHTFFTRMLVGVMVFGDDLTPDLFQKIRDRFLFLNTGITVCELADGVWKLTTWNDHAHL